jgi:hypothetical protein
MPRRFSVVDVPAQRHISGSMSAHGRGGTGEAVPGLLPVRPRRGLSPIGQAPIEGIVPEARRMPLYRLINDPFRALQERENVKGKPQMADLLLPKAVAA